MCLVRLTSILALLLIGMLSAPNGGSAAPGKAFDTLLGAWSGVGKINFEGGRHERIKCNAYYTGGGPELRLAIRCASASYSVRIRSVLRQEGSKLLGTWEERTYNASGNVTGRIAAHRISLSISGGGLSGSMSIGFGASRQSVAISTSGIELKGVKITLFKD